MSRLAALALRAYPPSFRARYGGELAALVEDLPESARTTINLFGGALRAWIVPHFAGANGALLRLRASISTTWVAWCAGFLVAPAMNKALLDPPATSSMGTVRGLMDAATFLLLAGWAIAAAGVLIIVLQVVVPGFRSHARAAVGPLVPALTLGAISLFGLVALVSFGSRDGALSPGLAWGFAIWVFAFVAFLGCLGVGPTVSLRRLEAGGPALRAAAYLAVGLATTLALMSGCALVAVLIAQDAALFNSVLPVILVLVVSCTASTIALISSIRGIGAARHA